MSRVAQILQVRLQSFRPHTILAALLPLFALGGCSAWVPGVEVRWYTPSQDGAVAEHAENMDSWVRITTSNFTPETAGRLTVEGGKSGAEQKLDFTNHGAYDGSYTVSTFHPGEYEFEYLVPHTQKLVYGEMKVYGPGSLRARNFIHRVSLLVDPTSGAAGGGQASILTDDDLHRVQMGDMVTKVVFVANLQAVDGRIAMIDREIRQLVDEEARLAGQEEYWATRLADRRRNAFYGGDYGDDIPGIHLALAQSVMGPEAYHWKRFSEADDEMRTYQEKRAQLRLPVERLREERSALRGLLSSVRVLHRDGDLIIASPEMIRRYRDATHEVTTARHTLHGPEMGLDAPYWFSEIAHTLHWPHLFSWLGIYPRLIDTNNRMETEKERIGELLLVMRIGPRQPYRLR